MWDEGNGTIDCYYDAQIVLRPTKVIQRDKALSSVLKKNPFLRKEAIYEIFADRLLEHLNDEFDSYCDSDCYYPPVVEEYGEMLEDALYRWCKENGFEYISSDGAGRDGGYEAKSPKIYY